jgi:hypothetical protein
MAIHQALHVQKQLILGNTLNVDLDAFVGGAISGGAQAKVKGKLTSPNCGAVPANVSYAACIPMGVAEAPPCACGQNQLLPVAAIASYYADPSHNDNAAIGLDPTVFTTKEHPNVLLLPCGIYYFDRIQASNPITIAVHGHVAIVVGGGIEVSSPTKFTLTSASTLDIVVGGTIYASSDFKVGLPAYPAKTRVYVAGVAQDAGASCKLNADCWSTNCQGTCTNNKATPKPFSVLVNSTSALNGGFYAPFGAFVSSSPLEMWGAIFAGDYHSSSPTSIHYDGGFIKQGQGCPGPDGGTPSCGDCSDCGNLVCNNGECGSCSDSSECCPPLYCVNGECVPTPK